MRNYPSRAVTYEGCLEFIEVKKQIRLFDFQTEIIKCFFEGKEIRTARGIGRSMCAKLVGEYVTYVFNNNYYGIEPEVVIPYQVAVDCGVLSEKDIEFARHCLIPEMFELEYCCK